MTGLIAVSLFFIIFAMINLSGMALYDRRHRYAERLKDEVPGKAPVKGSQKFQVWLKAKSKSWAAKTPEAKVSKLQDALDRSGLSRKYTPLEWKLLKQFLATMAVILSFVLLWLMEVSLINRLFFCALVYGVVFYIFRWMIMARTKGRQRDMQRGLPFTLDLITIGVSAGLSFDGAVLKVIEAQSNPLTFEFEKFLKEVRMGIVRRHALRNLMHRVDLDDFRTVIQAVIQADELGASLSQVLKIQSELIRYKRKMTAREKAMKAPVKMLFPLIIFIFPSIFVIILGPAVIQMMEYFL